MLDDKKFKEHETKSLSDVFNELHKNKDKQQIYDKTKKIVTKNPSKFSNKKSSVRFIDSDLKFSHIILGLSALTISILAFLPTDLLITESYAENFSLANSNFELNRHRINIQENISSNIGSTIVKEQITESRNIEFETEYTDNPLLPKGEEILIQEGVIGSDTITAVKTFENGEFIEEILLSRTNDIAPIPKIIDLGTSEFLAKHNAHIGDTIYLAKSDTLKLEPNSNSSDVAIISEYMDVVLLDLPNEEWCKVSFDGIEGFVKTSDLTSPKVTPSITEKNRVQRILITVNENMQLNTPSGLTLKDFENIFMNLPQDINSVFRNNYKVFYNVEKQYNINGLALAAIAIHESNWGTSEISLEKNNLFGYGSYDETPLESSFDFESYEECIETVTKSLVKYYINPYGTIIYNNEIALASYYNGPTLKGINTRYATDSNWHTKVYSHLEDLYNKLK